MPDPNDETRPESVKFDFSAYPPDSLFYDRRSGLERRSPTPANAIPGPDDAKATSPPRTPRARKERRRRIDPTTFEKQYTDDEMEFMTAMQYFKVQSGKSFPSHGEVLRVAASLGYRKVVWEDLDGFGADSDEDEPSSEVVVMPFVPG